MFTPDYQRLVAAAKNENQDWIPLYEHIICDEMIEAVMNRQISELWNGDASDRNEYFRIYCEFFKKMGYDTVSFEGTIGETMPGSGALGRHMPGVIKDRADFDAYPWDKLPDLYFEKYTPYFKALRENLPEGMKAVGGVGNGIFECVQDLVGFEDLCYMKVDDPELYEDMFRKVGENNLAIWKRFLAEFGDIYCVCRFGDDLGYKSNTMLAAEDVRDFIVPQYARIVEEVHRAGKPFLLHSCGCIFDVMDDIIRVAKIDAKHSNEDQIAPFPVWVEKYGDRIGNFGGIDTDAVCRLPRVEMEAYIKDVVEQSRGHGGFAFGSGNSIPNYVPVDQFVTMNEIIRSLRGE